VAFQFTALISFIILDVPGEESVIKVYKTKLIKCVLKRFNFLTKLSFQFIW